MSHDCAAVLSIREIAHEGVVVVICVRFLGGITVAHVHVHIHRLVIAMGKSIRNGDQEESCRKRGAGSSLPHEGIAFFTGRTFKIMLLRPATGGFQEHWSSEARPTPAPIAANKTVGMMD